MSPRLRTTAGFTLPLALAFASLALTVAVRPAFTAVAVTMGSSWDGPEHELQVLVDQRYGAGRIHVATDYLGAHAGDPDPWFWLDLQCPALLVSEVAGNASRNVFGWYTESGGETFAGRPVLLNDGHSDGVIFAGPAGVGANTIVQFPSR